MTPYLQTIKPAVAKVEPELTAKQIAQKNYTNKLKLINAIKYNEQLSEAKEAVKNGTDTTAHKYTIKDAEKKAEDLKRAKEAVLNGTASKSEKILVEDDKYIEDSLKE